MTKNPAYEQFKEEFPEVHSAFNQLFQSTNSAALDEKTKQLVYLGILVSSRYGPALPVHINKAIEAGATKDEVKAAIMLAIPAGGLCNVLSVLPQAMIELKKI